MFSENVTGFDDFMSNVTVTNGSVTSIIGGPSAYTLTIVPTGGGDVSITVVAGSAVDSLSNGMALSNTVVVASTIVGDTQMAISEFMLGRANRLSSNQPGLIRFFKDAGCGNLNASATELGGSSNGCLSNGHEWASFTAAWSDNMSYALASFGAHSFINENLIVGAMLQFDRVVDENNHVSGTGWMVGPYFTSKVADQPLYVEVRLLYGQTNNSISPLGTFTESFETERFLGQMRVTGEYNYEATTFMPLLDFTYPNDVQRAYTGNLGNYIGEQTVALTQVTAGLDFRTPVPLTYGEMFYRNGGVSTIYSSTSGGDADYDGARGRVHLGLNYETPNGGVLNLGAFLDGLGSDSQSRCASMPFEMEFCALIIAQNR